MTEKLGHNEDEPVVPEISKSEHLAEGIPPIMACVGTEDEHSVDAWNVPVNTMSGGQDVDLYESYEFYQDKKDFKGEPRAYKISPINGKSKFTKKLIDCTSLVAVGREVGSNTELSFLTHQNPDKFHKSGRFFFEADLNRRLQELKDKCSPGSIDVVITGGHFHRGDTDEYQKSLEIIGPVVQGVLGFEPLVIVGPKGAGEDDVYFNTTNRRLYVIRKYTGGHNDNASFKANEVQKKKEEWGKGGGWDDD